MACACYPVAVIAILNLLALFVACVSGHLAPAGTLVVAYAVLGPVHYLTEISWLHDRGYLVPRPRLLVVATVACVLTGFAAPGWIGPATMAVAGGCVACGLGAGRVRIVFAAAAAAALSAIGLHMGWGWVVAALLLVPTLIHVFGMTALFVVAGAVRSRARGDWAVAAGLAVGAASFVLLPVVDLTGGGLLGAASGAFGPMLASVGVSAVDAADRLLGFMGFAYAFHYLNWFIKARTIGWSRMAPERMLVLACVWGVVAAAYAIDVGLGLVVSLPLSFAHVLLEFPLDVAAARRLVAAVPCRRPVMRQMRWSRGVRPSTRSWRSGPSLRGTIRKIKS